MPIFLCVYSGFVTVLPPTFIWMLITISAGSEYFWKSYFIVSGIFLAVSFALGFFLPILAQEHWKRHPILWLFSQGWLAWIVAVLALGLINLTPLCVGQDNGDGNNNFTLCMIQSILVPMVYSPLEFILLCLAAFPGGWLLKKLDKSIKA
jgi:hypothetical protein